MTHVFHMVGSKSYKDARAFFYVCEIFRDSVVRGMLEYLFQKMVIVSFASQQKQHSAL